VHRGSGVKGEEFFTVVAAAALSRWGAQAGRAKPGGGRSGERTGCRGLSSRVAAVVPWCRAGGGYGKCAQELTGG